MSDSKRWLAAVLLAATVCSAEVYRHPNGFAIQVPAGWQVKQTDAGPSLIPPDATQETHLLLAEAAAGLTRPDDPQIIGSTDQQIRGLLPFMQRREGVEAANAAATPGVVLTWAGRNDAGVGVLVRVYTTVVGGQVAQLVSFGEQTAVERRDPALRAIFATLGIGAAPTPLGQPGDAFAGSFANDAVRLELAPAADGYRGTLTVGGKTYPATATRQGDGLAGTFTVDGTPFDFTLNVQGGEATLASGGKAYTLARRGATTAQPAPTDLGPAPPENGAIEILPDQRYEAGRRLTNATTGVSFVLPPGYYGTLPKGEVGFVVTNGQGKLALVGAAAPGGEAPSPQQLARDYLALLADPSVLGKGATLALAAQTVLTGESVTAELGGAANGVALYAQAIGRVAPATGNEALVVGFASKGEAAEVQALVKSLAASLKFAAVGVDPKPWRQGLAGKQITSTGGFIERQQQGGVLNADHQTWLLLGADGRATYKYLSYVTSTTFGQGVENREEYPGNWSVVTWFNGPNLVFLPSTNKGETHIYRLSLDGRTVMLNGKAVSVSP